MIRYKSNIINNWQDVVAGRAEAGGGLGLGSLTVMENCRGR